MKIIMSDDEEHFFPPLPLFFPFFFFQKEKNLTQLVLFLRRMVFERVLFGYIFLHVCMRGFYASLCAKILFCVNLGKVTTNMYEYEMIIIIIFGGGEKGKKNLNK